ncbi:MAG: efflux RND transporter periplasmic adaptor subunit [bacterium]
MFLTSNPTPGISSTITRRSLRQRILTCTLLSWMVSVCGVSQVHGNATPVAVASVTQKQLNEPVKLVGSIVPQRMTQISVQVSGMITSMRVDEGAHVSAGDVLFTLDDSIARINVTRSTAQLEQARAELREAQRQLAESERLRKDGYVPASTLETAQTRVAVAEAVIGQREADLAQARENLSRHTIKAPFTGVVTRKQAEQGQWLNPGSAALEIIDATTVRVEVAVPQRFVTGLAVGTQAEIEADALPGQIFDTRVAAVIPRGENNARTVPIWLAVENSSGQLLPGMSAKVTLGFSNEQPMVLAVPNDAIIRRADGSTLLWLVRDGEPNLTVKPLPVALGRRDAQYSEVVGEGLKAGDRVVVRGNESLRPDQAVYVVSAQTVGA